MAPGPSPLYFHSIGGFPQRMPAGIERAPIGLGTLLPVGLSRSGAPGGGTQMATASEEHTTDRALSDVEFEDLLQKTWEMVQNQKRLHPQDQSAESPSWT